MTVHLQFAVVSCDEINSRSRSEAQASQKRNAVTTHNTQHHTTRQPIIMIDSICTQPKIMPSLIRLKAAWIWSSMFLRASAHVVMRTPPPFHGLKSDLSPLGGQIKFPCQFGTKEDYQFTNATLLSAGISTPLSFYGSVMHGGGSCQISLSKTASSDPHDWKVIHTIIGGCPATTEGNLGTINFMDSYPMATQCDMPDANQTDCVKKYSIKIPREVPTGHYFFAWTWFNKIGNREMCCVR